MQRPGVRRQGLVDIGGAWRGEVRRRAIIVRRWSGDHGRRGGRSGVVWASEGGGKGTQEEDKEGV